jgi:gas vesicle protein
MPLLNIVLVLIVIGVVLWLINSFIPMASAIKAILNVVVVVAVGVWVLKAVGLWGTVTNYRMHWSEGDWFRISDDELIDSFLDESLETLDMANKNSFLRCFLTGLGTGITLAILFAPRSGGATRHFIGRKAHEGTETLKAKAAAGRDYIERQGAELRDRAKELVGRGAEAPVGPRYESAEVAGTSHGDWEARTGLLAKHIPGAKEVNPEWKCWPLSSQPRYHSLDKVTALLHANLSIR